MTKQILITLLFLCSACAGYAADGPAERAKALLEAAPFERGVACLPDCGPSTGSGHAGELALALARQSELLILAMDEDPKNVARLQAQAAAAGLLGCRLYVEQGSLDGIPFAAPSRSTAPTPMPGRSTG